MSSSEHVSFQCQFLKMASEKEKRSYLNPARKLSSIQGTNMPRIILLTILVGTRSFPVLPQSPFPLMFVAWHAGHWQVLRRAAHRFDNSVSNTIPCPPKDPHQDLTAKKQLPGWIDGDILGPFFKSAFGYPFSSENLVDTKLIVSS